MEKIQENNKEEKELKLETSRFNLSTETLAYLKQARQDLRELQKIAPFISGVSFLGSRMVGNEKKDSDLDCIICYNKEELTKNNGGISSLKFVDIIDEYNSKYSKTFESFKKWLKEINIKNDIKIPYHVAGVVDISESGIVEIIEKFYLYLESNSDTSEKYATRYVWPIVTPFFFSLGNDVYKARQKILSELSKRDDGEKLWKEIVEHLSLIERDIKTEKRDSLPKYKTYPKTIEEAKKFFKLQ